MIATCIIEISLAVYTVWRYHFDKLTKLVALILVLLATFQIAEYHVCRGLSDPDLWSHIGYVSITLLPAVGIHIINTIKGKSRAKIVYAAYLTSAAFVAFFALSANSITGHQCLGNYVMFQVNPALTQLYGVYYYGWVIIGMVMSIKYAEHVSELKKRQALYGFAFGYAAFLIPTTTANLINRATLRGIPSIMCGFAVILAVITVTWVMPRAGKLRVKIKDTDF